MKLRTAMSVGAVAAVALALVTAPLARAAGTVPGSFNTVVSTRILDTRSGTGAPKMAVAAGGTLTFTATAGLPAGSVSLTVTAVGPKSAGFLTVYPFGTPRPEVSNINFQALENTPNSVLTRVGTGGKVSIFNGSVGTVDLLADINGYFVAGVNAGDGGTFAPIAARRFLDTRIGLGAVRGVAKPFSVTRVRIAGVNGIPADASAVAVNVAALSGAGRGYISVYPGEPKPVASNLNFEARQHRANLVLVGIGPDGTISLFNGSGNAVDLLADVSGYFVGGTPEADGTFAVSTPFRVFDSRGPGGRPAGALTTSKIRIFDPGPPFTLFVKAVAVTVVAVSPQAPGFLTTWDGASTLPAVSNSNFAPGHNVAGSLVLPVNADGTISIFNGSFGTVDLVVDVNGLFTALPAAGPNSARVAAAGAAGRIGAAMRALLELSRQPHAVAVSVTRSGTR